MNERGTGSEVRAKGQRNGADGKIEKGRDQGPTTAEHKVAVQEEDGQASKANDAEA